MSTQSNKPKPVKVRKCRNCKCCGTNTVSDKKTDNSYNRTTQAVKTLKQLQSTPVYYEMSMLFKLSLSLKRINEIAQACGFPEKLIANDIVTVKLTQTIPFIPTDENIAEYEKIIKDSYSESDRFTCEKCKFAGYEYLRPIITASKPDDE